MGDDADIARGEYEAEQELAKRGAAPVNGKPLKKRGEVGKHPRAAPREHADEKTLPSTPESVADLSGKLRDELDKAKHYDFPKVQRTAKEKPLRPDLERIVESVFVNDMHGLWEEVKASLRVGERRSEHGVMHRALDDARKLSYDAHRLYITAKRERERWEADNEVVHAAMWSEASRALQHEKDTGLRSKQITDADVRAKCATLFADEWADQEKKRRAVKLTCDSLEKLADDAREHCSDLQTMLGKLRG